jgi:hypothetical protein
VGNGRGDVGVGANPRRRTRVLHQEGLRSDQLSTHAGAAANLIHGWAELMTEVAPLAAPILLLIRAAAAADADMAELLAETEQLRRHRMSLNARRLMRAGGTRGHLDHRTITDILWTYSSPELYELLVVKSGWSAEKYSAFVGESMVAALAEQS